MDFARRGPQAGLFKVGKLTMRKIIFTLMSLLSVVTHASEVGRPLWQHKPPPIQIEPNIDIDIKVEHHFAFNNDVAIHYAALGSGPLMVMIHGFPDYWYTWRNLMAQFSKTHRVVALDLRGYNLSDKPVGKENYDVKFLMGDIAAVIKHEGAKRATIIGHDWGAALSWVFAMVKPEMVNGLVVLNIPHPSNTRRELLKQNKEQMVASKYAIDFAKGAGNNLTPEDLVYWVQHPEIKNRYLTAFRDSSIIGMMNYYIQNYPSTPEKAAIDPFANAKVYCPVLYIHAYNDHHVARATVLGSETKLQDPSKFTPVFVEGGGHFTYHNLPNFVSYHIERWLRKNNLHR